MSLESTDNANQVVPGLYLVGTPIGNLADFSARGRKVLSEVDVVLAEDTRRTRQLLNHFEIKVATRSFHAHSSDDSTMKLAKEIAAGATMALVSDAGMPTISDPGAVLVDAIRKEHGSIFVVPGPTAISSALSLCGLRADHFQFLGFISRKGKDRKLRLADIANSHLASVLYESPNRVRELVEDFAARIPDRRIALVREITKRFEETVRGTPAEVLSQLPEQNKGEFVVVVEAARIEISDGSEHYPLIQALVAEGVSAKSIGRVLSTAGLMKKNLAYSMAESLK